MVKTKHEEQHYLKQPFLLSAHEIATFLLTTTDSGLSDLQVRQCQERYGQNKLEGEGVVAWYSILFKQVSNAMILVLVLAMALSYGVTDYIEGGVITAVIVLNVLIGFYQETQAVKKMDALRSLSSPSAVVLRDGQDTTIPSTGVVPGDIVAIKAGDTVPADLRMFEVMNLECDEAILTGEALPVAKEVEFCPKHGTIEHCGLRDRLNIAYSSSTVTRGRGRGIAVYTGMSTAIGSIAASMQSTKRRPGRSMSSSKHGRMQPLKGGALRIWDSIGRFLGLTTGTPLQRKLSKLAYFLFGCAIILAIIVFGVNKFNVTSEVAIYAIATGIAIIPESLIAVLTITMVVGMTQMRKRKVVVRQLSALEALGGVTNICSDKTGTLTQGTMVARKAWIPGIGVYNVEDSINASDPTEGRVTLEHSTPDVNAKTDLTSEKRLHNDNRNIQTPVQNLPEVIDQLQAFLESAALCNLATVREVVKDGHREWKTTGDPTEVALQVFAHRFGWGKEALEGARGWTQTMELPFDSSVKRMSVVCQRSGHQQATIFTKGAVERIIDLCTTVGTGAHEVSMTNEYRDFITGKMNSFAKQGLRVLAIARKSTSETVDEHSDVDRAEVEKDLCLLGLAGLHDPPRLETKRAVQACRNAGIQVTMLTGDHPATASAIARDVGIIPHNMDYLQGEQARSMVKTAADFDSMSDAEVDALPTLPLVVARCAPATKVKMVEALHRRGKYVAMTGDGVNDSPSLKMADVGIAMGMNGSDVAKSASDIVLADDNFASIVNAVEEGRRMFDNIQKFVLHLLTANVAEVLLLICGLGFQDSHGLSVFPLSPLQVLWINMLTSSFPAFGLGREKPSFDIMQRPPHDNRRGVFTLELIVDMLGGMVWEKIVTAITTTRATWSSARAAVFALLTWLILISAWEFKSMRRSLLALDPYQTSRNIPLFHDLWENQFLFWSVVLGALTVFPAIYIPGLNRDVFRHTYISWEWALAVVCVVVFISGVETWKLMKRKMGWFMPAQTSKMGHDGSVKSTGCIYATAKTVTMAQNDTSSEEQAVSGGLSLEKMDV